MRDLLFNSEQLVQTTSWLMKTSEPFLRWRVLPLAQLTSGLHQHPLKVCRKARRLGTTSLGL